MNPEANGQMQREWSWWIAIYLFLGGIGGGAYTIGAVNWLIGEGAEALRERLREVSHKRFD